jgi:hypothetical protein
MSNSRNKNFVTLNLVCSYMTVETLKNVSWRYKFDKSSEVVLRVFPEVPFWHSAEYGILCGIDFISRNFAKFFTVQYREIPLQNSV